MNKEKALRYEDAKLYTNGGLNTCFSSVLFVGFWVKKIKNHLTFYSDKKTVAMHT